MVYAQVAASTAAESRSKKVTEGSSVAGLDGGGTAQELFKDAALNTEHFGLFRGGTVVIP
jgi:hypothetical protein